MTAEAATGHIGVIEYCTGPGVGVMTVITGIAAGDMIRCLTHCRSAVVAAGTGTYHTDVVNTGYRLPGPGTMAVLAHVGCRNMRNALARRCRAVVTAETVAGHTAVIEDSTGPGVGVMAVVTGIAAGDMVRRLTHGRGAVMTA